MAQRIGARFSKRIWVVILILAALASFFVSKVVTSQNFNAAGQRALDDKKAVVMKLAATSAAASTAITVLPGDVATPIADQLAELSFYFVLILSALTLQKILLSVAGYVTFGLIIPFSCALGIASVCSRKEHWRALAIKLALFGLILYAVIPAGIHASDLISDSYQSSIEQTIEYAEQNTEDIQEQKEDLSAEDKNWWQNAGDYISNVTSSIGNGISGMIKKGEDTLGALLDAIAIMIITCCVIPIGVMLTIIWALKRLLRFPLEYGQHAQSKGEMRQA